MVTPKQSQKILVWCIESALGLIVDLVETAGRKLKQAELRQCFTESLEGSGISKKRITRVTYDLKRYNYIEAFEGDSVKLTDKAKIKVIDKYVSLYKADGKRRLVSFDIPEVKKRKRNAFRRSIKKMGFRQIQKSLWVSNVNLGDLVEIAARECGVGDYVAYFVVESSNIEKHINKLLTPKTITNNSTIVDISTT